MDNWTRIGDEEPTGLEGRTISFSSLKGRYSITITNNKTSCLQIATAEIDELWPLTSKFIKNDEYKFCGMADSVPEILDETCYYELVIGSNCSVTFWGDNKINRIDYAYK